MNRKIYDKVKLTMKRLVKADPFLTAKEIKTKITALKVISNRWVNKILSNELGMKSFVAPKKPMLTPNQVEFRDDWGHFHKGWGKRRWNGVLFSDETHIEIWRDTYRTRRVRRSAEDDRFNPKFNQKDRKAPPQTHGLGVLR